MGRRTVDWDLVLRLHGQGWNHREIARRIRRLPTTVGRGLRQRGVRSARVWSRTKRRHGLRLYSLWHHMRRRCENPAHPEYPDHGAKGVRVARAWRDFDAFYDWALATGYSPGLRLTRLNRARGFTPANCRWARREDVRRRPAERVSFLIRAFGESKGQMAWTRDPRCRVKQSSLRERLAAGWPAEEAITAPPGTAPSRLVPPPKPLRRKRGSRARVDWDEARGLYRHDGLTEEELAEYFGATPDAIRRGLRRLGILRGRALRSLDLEWLRINALWKKLVARCERAPRRRRIEIAPEWREFDAFLEWARASGSRRGRWLARKNPRRGYTPGNCEWVSRAEATRRRLAFP